MIQLSNLERETIISFNESEPTANIYTFNKPLRRKLEKYAQDRPEDCVLQSMERGGMAVSYLVPKIWVRLYPPRKPVTLTEEERQRRRERLSEAR